ncbi:MAG: rod shape-determining protein MreC [Candidatus Falkowbacteria bacterium]
MINFKFKNNLKIIVVIGLLIFLHFIGALKPVENLATGVFQPILGRFYAWSSAWRDNKKMVDARIDYSAQIADLKSQVSSLTVANAGLLQSEAENKKLRQFLNFPKQDNRSYVLANVISQENFLDAEKTGQNIVIDKGKKDGLRPGLALVNSDMVVVGKIIAIDDKTARACLLTNNICKLAVAVLNQGHTIGISEGDLGLTVKIDYVDQTEKVTINDIVVSSGLETDVPAGLTIGRVNQIKNNQNDVWQNISVEPLANFDDLGIVSVVLPK